MVLRLDDAVCDNDGDDYANKLGAVAPTLEFPRHSRVEGDHKVHTIEDYLEQTDGIDGGNHEAEEVDNDHDDHNDNSNDDQPLLQSVNVAVTSPTVGGITTKRVRGLGYIVFAALNISLMSACVKYATRYVTSHEAVFWRTILTWALNYAIVRYNNVDLTVPVVHRRLLLFRCFIGMVCISLQFYAMAKMVLTDAIVIIFTSPVFTFLLGALVLGETIERVDFVCALLSYVGVLFVTRPAMLFPHDATTKHSDSFAVLCAMGAAVTQAMAYISMRKLHDVHYMAVTHYFALFGIGFSLAMLVVFQTPLTIPSLFSVQLALVASACFSCIGLLFLTLGFQQEKAGIASVMRYFDVVFVFIWDTTFLGEHVDGYSVLGGLIILTGAVVIAIRRARSGHGNSGSKR